MFGPGALPARVVEGGSGRRPAADRRRGDGVDQVDALAATPVAEMHGVDAQESGPAIGPGLAVHADGDGCGAGLAEGEAAGPVGPGLADVVDVAGAAVLGDEAGGLGPGAAGHLRDVPLHQPSQSGLRSEWYSKRTSVRRTKA